MCQSTFDVAASVPIIHVASRVVLVVTEKSVLLDAQLWNHQRGRDLKCREINLVTILVAQSAFDYM